MRSLRLRQWRGARVAIIYAYVEDRGTPGPWLIRDVNNKLRLHKHSHRHRHLRRHSKQQQQQQQQQQRQQQHHAVISAGWRRHAGSFRHKTSYRQADDDVRGEEIDRVAPVYSDM